jgi:hypothetical protein
LVRRQPSADRIDAKSEEAIELRIEYLSLQNTRPEKIPVESLEVTEIKDDPVPLRNRSLIK